MQARRRLHGRLPSHVNMDTSFVGYHQRHGPNPFLFRYSGRAVSYWCTVEVRVRNEKFFFGAVQLPYIRALCERCAAFHRSMCFCPKLITNARELCTGPVTIKSNATSRSPQGNPPSYKSIILQTPQHLRSKSTLTQASPVRFRGSSTSAHDALGVPRARVPTDAVPSLSPRSLSA